MICPKCKKTILDNSIKCSCCGARIGSMCKKCNTYNSIYNLKCTKCKEELLKVCPSCKSVNFPNATKCRKCGEPFELKTEEKTESKQQNSSKDTEVSQPTSASNSQLVSQITAYSQLKAKEILIKNIADINKKIISVIGENGVGKSIVIKSAIAELKDSKVSWIVGNCSATSQLSPCGLIQDLLLAHFNVTNFCSDSLKLKKDSQKFFQNEFPTLTSEEIFNLINMLYPSSTDFYENIIINKQKTFSMLKKVFDTIATTSKTVFVLENYNMVDGMSFEFLNYLLNSDVVQQEFKFILTYNEIRPVRGYIITNKLGDDAYFDLALERFDENQVESYVTQTMKRECPKAILNQLTERSMGNPARLEQYTSLVMDLEQRNHSCDMHLPLEINDAIKQRLDFLKYDDITAYNFLMAAAIQGEKFSPALIGQIVKLTEEEILRVLVVLQQTNFILAISENFYSFRNSILWTSILELIKKDENYDLINERIFAIFSNYTLSSNAILAVVSKNINQKLSTLQTWTDTIKLASFIGDTYLYIIAQKQCLTLIDELEEVNSSLIKNNIYERLGKLISVTAPDEAKNYLPQAVSNAKKYDNVLKEIELLGYLEQCCIKTGDFYSAIECVDKVIKNLGENSYELEKAILKERKLKALLKIGNCGQIVMLTDTEILPVLEKYIGSRNLKGVSVKTLYVSWLKTYQMQAYALALEVNKRAFEVVNTMFELFEKNKFDEPMFICKTKLALALANTVKGDVEESSKILEEIIKQNRAETLDAEAISIWNTINIINKILRKNYTDIQTELFQVVTFANNVNDNFTKNILKTLLGKIFKEQGKTKQAMDIYKEQIIYFAKEKNSIGALLTWYFIAEASLVTDGCERVIEVAAKALDVAQSSKINNYYFIILFNKLLGETYMIEGEYELAKVHIEKGILVARKFELTDLLTKLYILYGKYLQEITLKKENDKEKEEYVIGASKMFNKARLLAQSTKNDILAQETETAVNALKSFCKLNNIELK